MQIQRLARLKRKLSTSADFSCTIFRLRLSLLLA
jgi:hypothetical protein